MHRSQLGVGLQDLPMATQRAIVTAAELGFGAVQIGAIHGDTTPEALSDTGRGDLRRLIAGRGLQLAAVDGVVRGPGFGDPRTLDERVAKSEAVLRLARDVSAPLVTIHLGAAKDENALAAALDAIQQLAATADRMGVTIGLETGRTVCRQLEPWYVGDGAPLRLCVDPAALLIDGLDPVESIVRMSDRIGLAYLRDATLGDETNPGHEVSLGNGSLDLSAMLAALVAAGYHGVHIVRRMGGDRPLQDIERARATLSGLGPH